MPALQAESAEKLIERTYPEMRWRILSLAADIDRIGRADAAALAGDPRMSGLKQCLLELLSDAPGRAERVQLLLSDHSPHPAPLMSGR